MHLLFTDPSTSPRTELGRIIFGALYGLSSVALYQLLGAARPADLLRQAAAGAAAEPVGPADRSRWRARSGSSRSIRRGSARRSTPRQRHVAYMSVWAVAFAVMARPGASATAIPGQWLPFWQQACQDGQRRAPAPTWPTCNRSTATRDRAGRATKPASRSASSLGDRARIGESSTRAATRSFERGCRLGFVPACRNAAAGWSDGTRCQRAADAGRLSDHSAGQQGADRRPHAVGAVRACLRAGLARRVRAMTQLQCRRRGYLSGSASDSARTARRCRTSP